MAFPATTTFEHVKTLYDTRLLSVGVVEDHGKVCTGHVEATTHTVSDIRWHFLQKVYKVAEHVIRRINTSN